MDGYVAQALLELQHIPPKRHQYAPSKMERPDYEQRIQYVKEIDHTPMTPGENKHTQRTTGKFLFYGRAIDNTMLHALNDIASAKDIKATIAAVKHFLDYAASNPNARIIYRASDIKCNKCN